MNKIVVINFGGGGGEEEKDYHEVDRDFAIECMIYQNSSLSRMFDYSATKGQVVETTSTSPSPSPSISNLNNNGGGDGRGRRPRAGPASSYLSFGPRSIRIRSSSKGFLERDHFTYTSEHIHSHPMHYHNSPSDCSRNGYTSPTAVSRDPKSETTTRTSSASPNFTMSLSRRTPLIPLLMDCEIRTEKNNDGDDHVYKGVYGIDEDEGEGCRSE